MTPAGRPALVGVAHLDLSVSHLPTSVRWYVDHLGFVVVEPAAGDAAADEAGADGASRHDRTWAELVHPTAGLRLALVEHPENAGEPFDERRCGLDHLSLAVVDRAALDELRGQLLARGVDAAPVVAWRDAAAVVLRDPDHIPIELWAPAG